MQIVIFIIHHSSFIQIRHDRIQLRQDGRNLPYWGVDAEHERKAISQRHADGAPARDGPASVTALLADFVQPRLEAHVAWEHSRSRRR